MILLVFWLVSGKEFKIMCSDDLYYVVLLRIIGDCLGGEIFWVKIISYGIFIDKSSWEI